jgi:hypothetical protein
MKNEIHLFRYSLLLLIFALIFSCRKSVTTPGQNLNQGQQQNNSTQAVPYPLSPVKGCSYAPDYGDSIIYPQPATGNNDYIVSPINNPGPGTYMSWPAGLAINSSTGAIDVTQSDAGERFDIGFVKSGTTDTCINSLIIGGLSYMDSVYVFGNNESQVYPYYDANPYSAFVCGYGSNSPGSCQFDVTGSAKSMKVAVDSNNGWIDLQKTLDNGAFGPVPFNGEQISPIIYYKLNNASNMTLQHIQVNIVYYYSKSQISPSLLNSLNTKLNNSLQNTLIVKSGSSRPPIIIITRIN